MKYKISVLDSLWMLKKKPTRNNFSIGVVTYINRYENYFKPNLIRLVRAFPDVSIYVAVNGFHDHMRQQKYLLEIVAFCKQFQNVKLLTFQENKSLSLLWNRLILCAYPQGILMLNDDILVLPFFRNKLEKSTVFDLPLCTINGSWSHFWITPDIIKSIGWFDERFPGIGEEDGDYSARLALNGNKLYNINSNMLIHFDDKPSEVSWGADLGTHGGKYTSANREFIIEKYHFSKVSEDGFRWVQLCGQYMKLKKGQETPDFYPDMVVAAEKIKMELN